MEISIYFLSVLFFILGWVCYFKPNAAQKFNSFLKYTIFNDTNILLRRKKVAVVFFIAACLLLTFGVTVSQNEKRKISIPEETIDKEIIFDIISVYTKRLAENSDDVRTLIKLAHAYESIKEKNREFIIWKRVLALEPENEEAKKKLNIKY